MEVCVKLSNGPSYVDVDGVRVHSGYSPEAVRSAILYEPSPEDVFLVTYPKAGTTWVQQIGYLILNKGVPACTALDFLRSSPFLEMSGATVMKQWTRRGFIKTHLPYSLLRKHAKAKYIYVCRNPKDVCISLFHHTRLFNAYDFADGVFEDFFEAFLEGNTDYGDYFEHVLSWYKHRNDPNVLFLHYEEIKLNLRQCVVKIAKFIGEEHLELLLNNEATLENVLRYSGIEYMRWQVEHLFSHLYKKDLVSEKRSAGSEDCDKRRAFVRKGIVGDWKNYFNADMNARMEEKINRMLSSTDLVDFWRDNGVL